MRTLSMIFLPLALTLAACGDGKDEPADDTDDTTADDTDPGTDDTDVMTDDTIVGIAVATPRFSILVEAVTKAGLAGALDGVTVFAPNNDAFEAAFTALGVSGVDDLSVDQLTAILTYHVIAGEVDSTAAIAVANGAGTAAALGGSLDLSLDGSSLKIDGATVITADIMASNGIIHEIDGVLVPNIVDVVTTDGDLSTLTAALVGADGSPEAPGLVGTLGGAGPFTVFAPVNQGFQDMLDANGAADLTAFVGAVGWPTVINVLTYHVAGSAISSAWVVANPSITTLGGSISVDVDGSTVTLNEGVSGVAGTNDSVIQVVDLVTSNGTIHKISKVVTPASGAAR
jgi:transforming growth factor-beta-induced protein